MKNKKLHWFDWTGAFLGWMGYMVATYQGTNLSYKLFVLAEITTIVILASEDWIRRWLDPSFCGNLPNDPHEPYDTGQ